jgi:hypothetical protein
VDDYSFIDMPVLISDNNNQCFTNIVFSNVNKKEKGI